MTTDTTPAPAPPEHPAMPEHWAVVASINGHDVLCISDNALSGAGELSEAQAQAIAGMAKHLLAFVGYGLQACNFDPDDAAPATGAAEVALRKVLAAVQRYMPPDGPSAKETLAAIIEIVDPWPLNAPT